MRNVAATLVSAILLGLLLPWSLFKWMGHRHWNSPAPDVEATVTGDINNTESEEIEINGIKIPVLMMDGTVTPMELDSYVYSVLLREMPLSFSLEALKAQCVVARTYALRQYYEGNKHQQAAVCTDSDCCQGFCDSKDFEDHSGSEALLDKAQNAVLATTGLVLTYDNELIDATYFSCSGGMTEDAVAVWGTDIPYLRSTHSPGEESSVNYVQTTSISLTQFRESLLLEHDQSPTVESLTYTAGGGVDTIQIGGKLFSGTDVRKRLNLRSTAFVITIVGDHVTITTKGYGHRVGMSQYGAEAMAQEGASFEQILKHYYCGTELTFLGDG